MKHYELEASVRRAKNGNREELLKIIEAFKPLIFKNASCLYIRNYDFYDLVQIGYVTLINAVAKYKKGSNSFAGYAASAIKNTFKNLLRENSVCISSLNIPQSGKDYFGIEFIDTIEDPMSVEDDFISKEDIRMLRREISRLPTDEMELIIMLYYSGIPLKIYAEKHHMAYLRAFRKKERVLKKLKGALEAKDLPKDAAPRRPI